MPDQNPDQFGHLDHRFEAFDPEVSVPTMSPGEIRRRGDRMRRRNTALATVGGVAAVALIVTPLSFLATRGDDGASPGPADRGSSVVDTTTSEPTPDPTSDPGDGLIPTDFPLAANLPAENEDGTAVTVKRDDASNGGLSFCSQPAWDPTDPAETASVEFSAPEDFRRRMLSAYFSPQEARDAFDKILARVQDCPVDSDEGFETAYEIVAQSDDSFTVTTRFRPAEGDFDLGLEVQQFFVSGNALLWSFDYGEGGGSEETIASSIQWSEEQIAPVLEALQSTFVDRSGSDQGTDDGTDDGTDTGTGPGDPGYGEVPRDFPIATGWPEPSESADDLQVPTEEEPYYDRCGQRAPAPGDGITGHLRAGLFNPEDTRNREVYTFEDAQQAAAYVAEFRAFFEACPLSEDSAGPGYDSLTDVRDIAAGSGSFGAVTHFEVDGAPAIGLMVLQVVQVGEAVFIDQSSGEGMVNEPSDIGRYLSQAAVAAEDVVGAMELQWGE